MNIVQRAINILARPQTEWPRIAAEPDTVEGLFARYALPLALLPVIGSAVQILVFDPQTDFTGATLWTFVLVGAALGLVMGLLTLFVMTLIADSLAPNFGGARNPVGAAKLLVYSSTATWVASFLSVIPFVGWLIFLIGFAYAAYLLYLGTTSVMKVPPTSAGGYTAVVIVIWILMSLVVTFVMGLIVASLFIGVALTGGAGHLLN